jgi:hypothetical protein
MAAAPVGEQQFEEMQTLSLDVTPELDPRLQLAIANHRTGKPMLTFASATADELPVVARVKSVEAWEALTDVFAGTSMGQAADGTWIVTGRVPVQRLEVVRGAPTVVSLKASQPIHPTLKFTVGAMSVAAAALPAGAAPNGASGVVVGIIDFGCDFAHAHFLQKGKTRILKLWDQGGIAKGDSPFGYGRVYSRGDINSALVKAKPYAALGYGPQPDSAFQQGTHGTHVMDIAAGNGGKAGQPGVAPKAGLVFVEVASSDIAWSGPESVKQTFGDSVQLLEAVRFVFDTAGDQPCVCNLSLGTNGGPHDGTSLVEQGLDAIVKEKPNRAIVIAASNSQEDGIHTTGTVPANGSLDVKWRQRSAGGGELEFWYPRGATWRSPSSPRMAPPSALCRRATTWPSASRTRSRSSSAAGWAIPTTATMSSASGRRRDWPATNGLSACARPTVSPSISMAGSSATTARRRPFPSRSSPIRLDRSRLATTLSWSVRTTPATSCCRCPPSRAPARRAMDATNRRSPRRDTT